MPNVGLLGARKVVAATLFVDQKQHAVRKVTMTLQSVVLVAVIVSIAVQKKVSDDTKLMSCQNQVWSKSP